MIYLFALFLLTATPDAKDARWQNGDYTGRYFVFDTIAACETHRAYMIRNVDKDEKDVITAYISKCATGKDVAEYNSFKPRRFSQPPQPTQPGDLKGDKS